MTAAFMQRTLRLSSISVSLNQSIKSGMNIGKSGSSGGYDIDGSGPKLANGYPAHLHITFGTAPVHDIGDSRSRRRIDIDWVTSVLSELLHGC